MSWSENYKSYLYRRHAWERGEMCPGFWWESLKEKDQLEDQDVDRIKMDLREIGWEVWSRFTWRRIGTVGGLL
jgi:hypothetical protein